MGARAGLDGKSRSPLTGIQSPDRPARSESLYRLNYPGTQKSYVKLKVKCFRYRPVVAHRWVERYSSTHP